MSLDTPPLEQTTKQPKDNQFRFLLNVFFEHWILIASFTLVGSLLLGMATWIMKPKLIPRYQTAVDIVITPSIWDQDVLKDVQVYRIKLTSEMLIKRTNQQSLAEEITRLLIQRDLETGGPYSRLVKKDEIAQAAAEIHNKLQIEPDPDENKIKLRVINCETPQNASDIAEMAARVFLEQHQILHQREGEKKHAVLIQELEDLRNQLFEAETAEWEFKQKMGFRTFGKINEDMEKMYEELNELKVTREEIIAKLRELESELVANADQLPGALDNVDDNVVNELFRELDSLLEEKMSMSVVYQPAYPGLIELEAQISEQQQAILEALKQLDRSGVGGSTIWQQRQTIYQQRMNLRMQLTTNDIRVSSIERTLEEMIPQIPELTKKNLDYIQLVHKTQSLRNQFNKVRERELELRLALSHGSGKLNREVVRAAVPMPTGGVGSRNVWVSFLLGGGLGFICALIIALMIEANDTSIRSIEDVNEFIGLDVIGTIPKMRFGTPRGGRRRRATYVTTVDEEQIDSCIVTQHDPKSPISEAYRTLRTNFQFATINEKPRTVMVTSAVPGEGKTTTAANLAVTMADRGIRVLIVDTDLRRPNVHRVLRMERGPGLADVLREGLEPKSVIRPTRIENLWIISSGRVPPNPSELIGSERMAQLMTQLGDEFDLVICDAPSVLVVTDPVLLATHVESCIMVVSTNNARRETVVRAKKLLETANVELAGVVVNGLETTRRHYYYYYYYYDDGAPVRRKWYHFY